MQGIPFYTDPSSVIFSAANPAVQLPAMGLRLGHLVPLEADEEFEFDTETLLDEV